MHLFYKFYISTQICKTSDFYNKSFKNHLKKLVFLHDVALGYSEFLKYLNIDSESKNVIDNLVNKIYDKIFIQP